jgi:tetratricopeptide (TPR) repeat protein
MQAYQNFQSIKQKGAYRILCLGESTTDGQYPRFLEQCLNQRNIGIHFSVIDRGRPGTNTNAILSRVESYLVEYHPDMVITMMGINDSGGYMPEKVLTTSEGTPFIRSLRTYNLARFLWLRILTKAKEMGLYKSDKDKQNLGKIQASLPKVGFKDTSTGPISAEASFKKNIDLNPENDKARVALGRFYKDAGKLSEAENLFKEAIEINPQNINAYIELGHTYQLQDKFPQAEKFLRKAIELDPKNDVAYSGLGNFLPLIGKHSEAANMFEKAIELNPKNGEAYLQLGRIYAKHGKIQQAEDSLRKAVELSPGNDFALTELGALYRKQNKSSQAEDVYKKAISLDPKSDRALGAMSLLYQETGRPELAKASAEKATKSRSENYLAFTVNNYRKLKGILDGKRIKLVCAQYPVRNVEPLKRIFEKDKGIIFVDNEQVFEEAVKKADYKEYFIDMFGGDFGHCTQKGNELLAQNIADVILREVFNK